MARSARNLIGEFGKGVLLHGSDLPKQVMKTKIVSVMVNRAPEEFNSPLIMEIEPYLEKTHWALNKTNINALITVIGDDWEKWGGYELELTKYLVTNPQTGKETWGLAVTKAVKLTRKVKSSGADVPF
jgi:hypothetical protein